VSAAPVSTCPAHVEEQIAVMRFADKDPEGTAIFDVRLDAWRRWSWIGLDHYWVQHEGRQRDTMNECHFYAMQRGFKHVVFRLSNQWDGDMSKVKLRRSLPFGWTSDKPYTMAEFDLVLERPGSWTLEGYHVAPRQLRHQQDAMDVAGKYSEGRQAMLVRIKNNWNDNQSETSETRLL
jgi:hypothetical protein